MKVNGLIAALVDLCYTLAGESPYVRYYEAPELSAKN
jgi:hypothetical protein